MSENRSTWVVAAGIPFFYPTSIRAFAHPTFVEWRGPCGWFDSVRAAPTACESRSASLAPGGNDSLWKRIRGRDRRTIPSGTRACPHNAGPRDRLRW